MKESIAFTFPYQTNRNDTTNPATLGQLILEQQWKNAFSFTEIVNNYGLKQETLCQIVRFPNFL